MLESLWYFIILILQILQVNPDLRYESLQFDVFVGSKQAYTFTIQGNAVQGQLRDQDSKKIFGEFESTRRLPQAYIIFAQQNLSPELEESAKSADPKGKAGTGTPALATKPAGASKEKPKEPPTFTVDFTQALKQLVPFTQKSHQVIAYPEMERFLSSGEESTSKAPANTADKGLSPTQAKPTTPTTTIVKDGRQKGQIEIRQYRDRLVLSADFMQTVIIVSFKN